MGYQFLESRDQSLEILGQMLQRTQTQSQLHVFAEGVPEYPEYREIWDQYIFAGVNERLDAGYAPERVGNLIEKRTRRLASILHAQGDNATQKHILLQTQRMAGTTRRIAAHATFH